MTKPPSKARNAAMSFLRSRAPILAVLALAALLRLDGIGFGLPDLNDPDEPMFVMLAYGMLDRGSFDPQWFGHPGTITLYSLALVMIGVAGSGLASGRFSGIADFAQAAYLDPGIVILPARILMAAGGVLCVWLTYRIGRRLWGNTAGLIAATFLAVNAVHIAWSQVIRTDVQASVFMLLCVLAAIRGQQEGGLRAYALAGICAGLACAAKWPAAIVLLAPLGAALGGMRTGAANWRHMLLPPLAALAALLAISPFLLINHDVVLANLAGEARAHHPGATGYGLPGNLAAYFGGPLAASFGAIGLVLAVAGTLGAASQSRAFRLTVCPVLAAFLLLISAQHLWWERWIVPGLPFLALGLGWIIAHSARALLRERLRLAGIAAAACALLLALPMLSQHHVRAAERRSDTRQTAAAWIARNAPAGATIVVEHAAIGMLDGPWHVKFPLGSAGCVDARGVLQGRISAGQVDDDRRGSPVVDLGHIAPDMLFTCKADYYVLSGLRRYEAEQHTFPAEYARYLAVVRSGTIAAQFHPVPGQRGGPDIAIVVAANRP